MVSPSSRFQSSGGYCATDSVRLLRSLLILFFPGRGIEQRGVDKEVDVLGEARDQAPALGEAGSALEDHLLPQLADHDPQDLGDVVILLDELFAEAGVLGGRHHRLLEVRVFEEPHRACPAWQSAATRTRPWPRSSSAPRPPSAPSLRALQAYEVAIG